MNKQLIIRRCRRLRRNQTESERIFWSQVRNCKINRLKFLRQHPFVYKVDSFNCYNFIADFYCTDKKIVIELDGEIHNQQKEYDENRDLILREMDLKIIRFKNNEIERAVDFVKGL